MHPDLYNPAITTFNFDVVSPVNRKYQILEACNTETVSFDIILCKPDICQRTLEFQVIRINGQQSGSTQGISFDLKGMKSVGHRFKNIIKDSNNNGKALRNKLYNCSRVAPQQFPDFCACYMETTKLKYLILNSTILFVVAGILEMTLHEFGHYFAAIFVHAKGISIHHNYVSNIDEGLPLKNILIIKGAGPLVSLIIGIFFHIVCSLQKERNVSFLFKLYMAAFGYIGFFGYLMLAPIFTGGDTGYICNALQFPLWLTIGIAVSGGLTLYFLIRALMKYFVEMGSKEILEIKETRISFIHSLLLIPVLFGIPLTTILNLPVVAAISLIAPLFSPFTLLWDYGNALNKNYHLKKTNNHFKKLNRLNFVLILLFILTIIYNRMLVKGIYFN